MKRNPTRSVRVGNVFLGSAHPVAVQSMCATRTQDVDATVEQAEAIRRAGGALVRVAVDSPKDVLALAEARGGLEERGRAAQMQVNTAYPRIVAGKAYAFPYSPFFFIPFTWLPRERAVIEDTLKHVALGAGAAASRSPRRLRITRRATSRTSATRSRR